MCLFICKMVRHPRLLIKSQITDAVLRQTIDLLLEQKRLYVFWRQPVLKLTRGYKSR